MLSLPLLRIFLLLLTDASGGETRETVGTFSADEKTSFSQNFGHTKGSTQADSEDPVSGCCTDCAFNANNSNSKNMLVHDLDCEKAWFWLRPRQLYIYFAANIHTHMQVPTATIIVKTNLQVLVIHLQLQ